MRITRENIVSYVLALLLIIIAANSIYQGYTIKNLQKQITKNKRDEINNDTLRKTDDGQYSKLVNDLFTSQKQLFEVLQMQNQQLYDQLKSQNRQLISIINSQHSFKPKVDTVYVQKDGSFVDSYPDEKNWFIRYKSTILPSGNRIGDWQFSQLPIDITISEKEPGLYEANLSGPDWLIVDKLDVSSLQINQPKQKRWSFWYGAKVGRDVFEKQYLLQVDAAIQHNNIQFGSSIDTQGRLLIGLMKKW